jgi:predicted helicase
LLTARDAVVYGFNRNALTERMEKFVDEYNGEVDRYRRAKKQKNKAPEVDEFVRPDLLKWTHNLKQALKRDHYATVKPSNFRRSLYRPFCKKWMFYDRLLNERVYLTGGLFPSEEAERENIVICCTSHTQMPFTCIVTDCLPNEAVGGRNGQCFGFFTYSADGKTRSENITDWALAEFRARYNDYRISKFDILHYVYAMLHHPLYRQRFAQNLQREIPRVPLVEDFRRCAEIGERLVQLHLSYEEATPFELEWIENAEVPLSYRVGDRMRLNRDRGTIKVNTSLTLAGIPATAFNYVLGTRSALEWVIDQYRYQEDPETEIVSDPNNPEDEQYIVRLIERVTSVSVETVRVINRLPAELTFEQAPSLPAG